MHIKIAEGEVINIPQDNITEQKDKADQQDKNDKVAVFGLFESVRCSGIVDEEGSN